MQFAVVFIMHPKKVGDAVRILNNITGSGAYHHSCRCCWFFKRDVDDNGEPHPSRVLMFCEKQSLATHKPPPVVIESVSVTVAAREVVDEETVRASRLAYGGTTDKRLRETLAPVEKSGRSADVVGCIEWLRDRLNDGAVDEPAVRSEAEARGWGRSTYLTARKKLGVTTKKKGAGKGDGWQLSLELGLQRDEHGNFVGP